MSCMNVTDEHINVLIWAFTEWNVSNVLYLHTIEHAFTVEVRTRDQKSRIGQYLRAENDHAYNDRYTDEGIEEFYSYQAPSREYTPVEVLKALNGYEYQTIDSSTWRTSIAQQICDQLTSLAIKRLAGYDEAAWQIDEQQG